MSSMERLYYLHNAEYKHFIVDEKPLGKGGQATVYNVIYPSRLDDCCIKIYHNGCKEQTIERLKYMIAHPPAITRSAAFRICWPEGFVYNEQHEIVGFYMPKAFEQSRDLYILCYYCKGKTIASRFKGNPAWFDKFERTSGEGVRNRLKMMANISQAFYQIHKANDYVVLDVKPENILATATGKVSIVDTDSFQIADNQRIIFPGAAATPEYCAPEFESQYNQHRPFTKTNDCFSLAVVFYQILIGLHPYSGMQLLEPYDTDEYNNLAACINRHLFVYGSNKRYIKQLSPNPHMFFERLPRQLQLMFIKAFDAPNYRPTMEDWCKELYNILK